MKKLILFQACILLSFLVFSCKDNDMPNNPQTGMKSETDATRSLSVYLTVYQHTTFTPDDIFSQPYPVVFNIGHTEGTWSNYGEPYGSWTGFHTKYYSWYENGGTYTTTKFTVEYRNVWTDAVCPYGFGDIQINYGIEPNWSNVYDKQEYHCPSSSGDVTRTIDPASGITHYNDGDYSFRVWIDEVVGDHNITRH